MYKENKILKTENTDVNPSGNSPQNFTLWIVFFFQFISSFLTAFYYFLPLLFTC